jgi:hypothetical protein
MSNKILVKQSGPTVFQSVGPTGTRPSFMDMARTTFAPRGQVGVGQRLRGLAGMAGKGAAAAVTAQQTAERMQAGDASAPLQAGITYQGIDPTGTINPNIGEQMYKPGQPQVLPTPPNPAGMQPNTTGQRPGAVGVAPTNSTFTSPIDMSQYPSIAHQFDPNHYINQTLQLHQDAVTPQVLAEQQQMGDVLAQQGGNQSASPGGTGNMGSVLATQQIRNAFVGTLFDKLGPDMVYKMTPHEIGTVSALMHLKLS